MTEKISRICWNDYQWKKPSGRPRKSTSDTSYEYQQGFGFEEWLFDKSKTIDGFKFGFLQTLHPATTHQMKPGPHAGNTYRIWLYTILNKQRLLVGYINNAVCIHPEESVQRFREYKRNGWIKEMMEDVRLAGANIEMFKSLPESAFFNLKFRLSDAHIFDEEIWISKDDLNTKSHRYKLLNKRTDFLFDQIKLKRTDGYFRKGVDKLFIDPYHNKIQNALSKILSQSGKYRDIQMERAYVDLRCVNADNGNTEFFEIKTDHPKRNIRLAFGQLLEYSMFPDNHRANKLVIVGDAEPEKDVRSYIKHLRNTLSVQLFYRWIDLENMVLSEEY